MFGPNFSHLILEPFEALQNYKEMVLTKCQYDNSESFQLIMLSSVNQEASLIWIQKGLMVYNFSLQRG